MCIRDSDNTYQCIAAASILAKVYHDEYIENLVKSEPDLEKYDWQNNMCYGTKKHIEAIKEFGNIQYLVNNAGHSSKVRSMRYVKKDDWQSVFNVNVEGVYRLTQAILPNMIENGGGSVVTISSMAAINPGLMGGVPYSSAKAAVAAMMTAMRQELREHGIRSCTIYPAEVDTPILDNRPLPPDAQARSTMMMPEDIAETILLCMRMPHRTIVQDVIVSPTIQRDVSEDMKIAKTLGSN